MYIRNVVLALLLCLSPLSVRGNEPNTAQQTVEIWLASLDAKDYETTWHSTAQVFQSQVDLKSWKQMAGEARKPLGAFKSRELLGAAYHSRLPGAPAGDYIIFQYRSHFSEQPGAIETITPVLVDGIWRVSGYYVR